MVQIYMGTAEPTISFLTIGICWWSKRQFILTSIFCFQKDTHWIWCEYRWEQNQTPVKASDHPVPAVIEEHVDFDEHFQCLSLTASSSFNRRSEVNESLETFASFKQTDAY